MNGLYDQLLEQSLQFQYHSASVSLVHPGEVAPWRILPTATMAQILDGVWAIERDGYDEYLTAPGELVLLPPGIRHRTSMVSEGTSKSRWAHFNILLCGYLDVFSMVDIPMFFQGDIAQRVGEIVTELAVSHVEPNPLAFVFRRKALEFELCSLLFRESTLRYQSNLRLEQVQRLLPVLNRIDHNLGAYYTRHSLAEIVGLSPSRFAQIFKEAMGLGPIDYIVRLRMQRAQYLLLNTRLTIDDIAAEVGYDDAFYFSRLFKMHYGLSPRNFRNAEAGQGDGARRAALTQ